MICLIGEKEMKIGPLEVDLVSNGENAKELFVTEKTTGTLLGSAEITRKLGFTVMIVKDYNNEVVYGHSQISRPFEKEIGLAKSTILENYMRKK